MPEHNLIGFGNLDLIDRSIDQNLQYYHLNKGMADKLVQRI